MLSYQKTKNKLNKIDFEDYAEDFGFNIENQIYIKGQNGSNSFN